MLSALLGFGLVFVILRLWFPTYFSIRWRVREGPLHLRRERSRMISLLKHRAEIGEEEAVPELLAQFGQEAASCFQAWNQEYLQERFGRPPASRPRANLADLRKSFEKS